MVFEVSDGMEGSFNPRAHVGRDSYSNFLLQTPLMFQSTRPRGARPATGRTHTITLSFNPRAHVGRDPLPGSGCCWATGFNPRAHVGRDRTSLLALSSRFVSIHAPTWGATDAQVRQHLSCCVSIHAPTWGATTSTAFALYKIAVSIHAPTWGATG